MKVAAKASVHPDVTVTCRRESMSASPVAAENRAAIARANSGIPEVGAYCPCPARMAAIAASLTKSGPSKLGKPCPRLMARIRRPGGLCPRRWWIRKERASMRSARHDQDRLPWLEITRARETSWLPAARDLRPDTLSP